MIEFEWNIFQLHDCWQIKVELRWKHWCILNNMLMKHWTIKTRLWTWFCGWFSRKTTISSTDYRHAQIKSLNINNLVVFCIDLWTKIWTNHVEYREISSYTVFSFIGRILINFIENTLKSCSWHSLFTFTVIFIIIVALHVTVAIIAIFFYIHSISVIIMIFFFRITIFPLVIRRFFILWYSIFIWWIW